jgi:hypothetical protein
MYLCGLALFAAQGPAVASALIAFFNQMVFVRSRIAMPDISALAFGLFAIAAFISGFRKPRPHVDGDLQPADDFSELDLRVALRSDQPAPGSLDGRCAARQFGASSAFSITGLNLGRSACGPSSSGYSIHRCFPRMAFACCGNRN